MNDHLDAALKNSVSKQRLPESVKAAIVGALACFDTPSVVAAFVKVTFGIVVTPQAIEAYDPTKRAGRALSKKWRMIFDATRANFVKEISGIGIAHKAVRLRALDRMANKAEERGNIPLALDIIVQAAKECGDYFTNRHKIETNITRSCDPNDLTDAELAAIIKDARASGELPAVVIHGGLPNDYH